MIEIRKSGALRTTWEELKASIKNNTSSLNIGDEIDIVLKTGERVTLVCEQVKNGHMAFFTKELLEDTHAMDHRLEKTPGYHGRVPREIVPAVAG